MGKLNSVSIEYYRLKSLFDSVDQTKAELVDNLLNEAAFMKVQLSNLRTHIQTHGAIQFSTKGDQRQTEAADIFSSKLVCADCGGFYGKKKWHSNTSYERFVYQCNSKFQKVNVDVKPHN